MTKKDAKELAIAFEAYCEARRENRDLGIMVWGDLLLRAQRITGVELLEPDILESMIGYARKNYEVKT